MKILSILLLSFVSIACATSYTPNYIYNEIQVANLSNATITDVNLRMKGSDKTLNCDAVAKNALCYAHFGKRRYPQQGVELSWTDGDGSKKSQQLTPAIASYFSTGGPLQLILEINEDGSAKPIIKQESGESSGG